LLRFLTQTQENKESKNIKKRTLTEIDSPVDSGKQPKRIKENNTPTTKSTLPSGLQMALNTKK
jgi:hypothetical protein